MTGQYLVISDIHLGARSTTYKEILSHLQSYFHDFRDDGPFCKLDAIFIAGDLTDDTITFGSEVTTGMLDFFLPFCRWCKRHDISLWLLEGTPRHDRRQGRVVENLIRKLVPELDFKYIAELSIQRHEKLNLNVLCVPDECRHTAALIEEDTEKLLNEAGLQKADIAIMHGMFEYQLGTIPMNHKVLNSQWWLNHVEHYLSIGHIHTYSQYERIIAQGSFDRLTHGYEEPKGGVLFTRGLDGEWVPLFIENTQAKIYKTFEIETDVETALKMLDKAIRKLPDGSHVRIKARESHPILQGLESLRKKYLSITFTKKSIEDHEHTSEEHVIQVQYDRTILNASTIVSAILAEIESHKPLQPSDQAVLYPLLEEVLNE